MNLPATPTAPAFTERQVFLRHWWGILLLALAPALLPGILWLADSPKASSATAIWLGPLLVLAVVGLILCLRLETRLDATGVHYRFWPLRPQFQPWANVRQAYVRQYDPLGEYGGWGPKGTRRNRALNVAGGEGIQLELTDGTRLLLGTQRPAEARQALEQLGHYAPAE